jgi:glycosyltransferase involved in cell wall biosynthesis
MVSVIIPAFNQSRYLLEAVRSVLAQTHGDLEILIVDDGSTDDTPRVSSHFTDARVRYIRQENRGLSSARNTGIRYARGEFLTYLDSDDLFLSSKLELLLAVFNANPSLGLVSGQAELIDERGRRIGEVFDRGLPADPTELLLRNPLHVGSVLIRREWQERVGLFDETLRSYEDWDMWLRLALAGCPMSSIAQPVSLYRFHSAQMTRLGHQMTTASFAVLDKVYGSADLPPSWQSRRTEAYGRAFLRAAAQGYTAGQFTQAKEYMRMAVERIPNLRHGDAEHLARTAAGWANHAKTSEPLEFLEGVYANLPDELEALRRRRGPDLSREALQLSHAAYRSGDEAGARRRLWQAIRYEPWILLERRVLRTMLRLVMSATLKFSPLPLASGRGAAEGRPLRRES